MKMSSPVGLATAVLWAVALATLIMGIGSCVRMQPVILQDCAETTTRDVVMSPLTKAIPE